MMKAFFSLLHAALLCVGFSTGICAQTPLPGDAPAARQLLTKAKIRYDSLQYPLAQQYAEQAYRFFHEMPGSLPADLAEAAYQTGRALYRQDSFIRAESLLNEAVNIWATVHPGGSTEEVNACVALGWVMFRLKNADGMLEQGQKALYILDSLPSKNYPERIAALRLVGRLYYGIGRYNKAIPYYEEALKYARIISVEDDVLVAEFLRMLGSCNTYCGFPDRAMNFLELALSIQQKNLPPFSKEIGDCYMALGICQRSINKYSNAIVYFEKAIEIQEKTGGKTNSLLAYAYSQLGQVCLKNQDYLKALTYFQKEDTVLILNNAESDIAYAYACRDLGLASFELKRYKDAIQRYEKALILFQGSDTAKNQIMSLDICNLIFQIGRAQSANGDYEAAIKSFNKNELILKRLYWPEQPTIHESDAEMAHAYQQWYLKTEQDSLLEKSRAYFQLAENGIAQQLQNETNEDAQKKLLAEAIPVFENAIHTELLYSKKHPEDLTSTEKVWQFSEALHSYLLFSATQEANARHFAGIPDAELQRDSMLRAALTDLQKRKESLLEDNISLTDSSMVALSLQISAKRQEQNQLRDHFEEKYPDYFRLKYDLQTASLRQVQHSLSPQQTLLEYFTGDSSIFVFVVQEAGSQMVELPRDFPLSDWVQAFHEGISGYHTATEQQKASGLFQKTVLQYADAAQKLYQKLVAPVAKSLTSEIIVVPGDGLASLPFEALLSAAPKDLSNFNTYPFLVRNHNFQYTYSATMLHQMIARQHPQKPTDGLLAFAPFFEEDTASLALRLAQDGAVRRGLSALPFSGEEVFRAKKRYGGDSEVLTGEMATKQKFLKLASRYKILHLATHGKANHLAGDFSFLAFTSGDGIPDNGLLSVGELYNLPINADMVLLSACETGIGEQQRGEGVVSLARAFAYAGAKSIVASLWSVNDKSTMLLMDNLYAGIKSGKPKNIALANAKRQYLEKNPGQPSHPFFWAGFVGVGDMGAIKN